MKTTILYFALLIFLSITHVSTYAQESQTKDEIIKLIDAKVSLIEDFKKKNPKKLNIFNAIEKNDRSKLEELPEMPEWVPDDSLFMVYILSDDKGRVLMHEVVPTSGSGDWTASYAHYFDDHGRTIMFEFYSGSFNSGCADILRITMRYYYDTNFKLAKKIVTYTDKNDKPIKNIERCDTYGIQRKEPKIYRAYKDIAAKIDKSQTPYIR